MMPYETHKSLQVSLPKVTNARELGSSHDRRAVLPHEFSGLSALHASSTCVWTRFYVIESPHGMKLCPPAGLSVAMRIESPG
jgi:hypothetical protein